MPKPTQPHLSILVSGRHEQAILMHLVLVQPPAPEEQEKGKTIGRIRDQ